MVRLLGLGWVIVGFVSCFAGYAPKEVTGLLFSGATLMVSGILLVIYAKLDEISKMK